MKTIAIWIGCAALYLVWGGAAHHFDKEREQIEARDAAMAANATKNAAAYALCKSENATPVWNSRAEVDCLTTKGHRASRQVVAVNP